MAAGALSFRELLFFGLEAKIKVHPLMTDEDL
jgi:hypothetical protein